VFGARAPTRMEGPEEPKRSSDLKPPALGRQRRIIAGIVQIANSVRVTW
jgi:hypothetical protein